MPQQLDNLIFDRTEADVSRVKTITQKLIGGTATEAEKEEWLSGTMKGAYNAGDLNRVGAAVEYLTETLYSMGYNVPTITPKRTVTLTNIVPNSSFEQNSNWNSAVYDTAQAYQGTRSSKLGSGTTVTTTGQITTPVAGHKYYGRSYIKSQGDIQPSDCRFEMYAGDGAGLNFVFAWNQGNFPDWTMRSTILTVETVNGTSYIVRNFVVGAVNPCWTDCLMIIDLTKSFGAGNEPEQAWCDENIPYFDGSLELLVPKYWSRQEIPTQDQMEQYIENIQLLRDCLPYAAPDAPEDADKLTFEEANHIEEILYTLERVLLAMQENSKLRQANTLFMIAGGVFHA